MTYRAPSNLSAALIVAGAELRRRLRNRSAMITALAAPLAVAFLFNALIGGATTGSFRVGVVDLDRSEVSRGIVDALSEARDGRVRFVAVRREAAARDRVDRRTLDAALVIPTGFASVTSGGRSSITVLRSADQQIGGEVGLAVATDVAQRFNNTAAAVALEASVTGSPPAGERLDGLPLERAPLKPVLEELAHAVVAQRRAGGPLPEELQLLVSLLSPGGEGGLI